MTLTNEKHAQVLKLVEKLCGKSWFEAWELNDVLCLIQQSQQHPKCKTCNGSGYQGIIGYPHCQGGCEDCAGTGLSLPPSEP